MTARAMTIVRRLSLALIALGGVALVRALPGDQAVSLVKRSVGEMGAVGLVVFGVAYVLAALLFLPGSALTVGAGALFGLERGTIVVSFASTTAAALAFLIARHLARARVEDLARRYPRFLAVDSAIAEGGWRVIGLLRLSPAVPFSAGNYLFGLTGVGFWPYTLASWAFMLPGTFLYVYLGYAGREGLGAAAAGGGRTAGEWALLAAGLLATAAVTAYVMRLARRALARQGEPVAGLDRHQAPAVTAPPAAPPSRAATLVWPIAAALVLATGVWAQTRKDRLSSLLGPPPVQSGEAYEAKPAGPSFDHSAFDALLRAHVDERGLVDYEGLRAESTKLDAYVAGVAKAPFAEMGRNEKLALLLNAYNAFTLRLILDYWPLASIKDIPADKRWDDRRWQVAGGTYSLNQIEHEQIRPKFREPRVHFALVCAARGCPPLRREAYVAARLEAQLEKQAGYVHSQDRWLRLDAEAGVVHLTELYKWYAGDFEQAAGSVLAHVARYSEDVKRALAAGRPPKIRWIPYDWSLNGKETAP